jgi:large subunit ribosomal protein L6
MSRIGRKPVPIPDKVSVDVKEGTVSIKGPNGSLEQELPAGVNVSIEDGKVLVGLAEGSRHMSANRGLARALLANMVTGVTAGFSKTLELVGTGYRIEAKGANALEIEVGFSHKVDFPLPDGISADVGEKNLKVTIKGADKQLVGQVAADIRALRPPEPYKGKGIRYLGEYIKIKAGKAGKAAT